MLGLMPLAATVAVAAAYGAAMSWLRRRGDRWPLRRAACLMAGSACAATAVLPPVASHDDAFPVHVVQHLLLGMAGPAPGDGWPSWRPPPPATTRWPSSCTPGTFPPGIEF